MRLSSFDYPWLPAPEQLALSESEVHLWRVSLDTPAGALESLSEAERARGKRFVREGDGRHFLNGRATLRRLLSRYTGVPAAELTIETGPQGKPALTGRHAWLRFNLSHSAGWMLLAFSHSREVGVDLEAMRERIEFEAVGERCFTPAEMSRFRGLPHIERPEHFYALWTAMEARLKARGTGLFGAGTEPDDERWVAYPVRVQPGFAAAVAVEGAQPQLRCWSWPN